MHTNFSNELLRTCGSQEIYEKICEAFRPVTKEHIDVYGEFNEQRLTGLHETASINDFSYGFQIEVLHPYSYYHSRKWLERLVRR